MRRGMWWFVGIALLAGCGGSGGGSGARPDPVSLINKAAGCTLENGGPSGSPGIDGSFLVATCNYPARESLTVKTFNNDSDRDRDIDAGGNAAAVIAGPRWVVYVFTAYGQDSPDPTAEQLAQQLGGTVR